MPYLKSGSLTVAVLFFFSACLLISCGRGKTERLLMNKRWQVYDVTPPDGTFNIEKSNRAKDLKNGFYKNAWFEFLPDSLFVASFGGKADTGKYAIRPSGKRISLFPRYENKLYEQIRIVKLNADKMQFTTQVADFHMTLHLKATSINEQE